MISACNGAESGQTYSSWQSSKSAEHCECCWSARCKEQRAYFGNYAGVDDWLAHLKATGIEERFGVRMGSLAQSVWRGRRADAGG